jgi:Cd2+/Zn2+-exporting ATPase
VAWRDTCGWPVLALALFAIATDGLATVSQGWIALRHFSLNMNFVITLAVVRAAAVWQWPEAALSSCSR